VKEYHHSIVTHTHTHTNFVMSCTSSSPSASAGTAAAPFRTIRWSILQSSFSLLCFVGWRGNSYAIAENDGAERPGTNENIVNAREKTIDCGVYLAPSSIPFAGLGMYVGNRSFEENDIVTGEDIVIPIFERDWHTGHRKGKVRRSKIKMKASFSIGLCVGIS
jgi:hypothetical protein